MKTYRSTFLAGSSCALFTSSSFSSGAATQQSSPLSSLFTHVFSCISATSGQSFPL